MAIYKISFGKSTSSNYNVAVEIASNFQSYKQSGEGKNIKHEVTFGEEEIDLFFELYDLVGRWKSSTIYIDGARILHGQSNFLWCFRERQNAFDKNEYCFGKDDNNSYNDNFFGCKYIKVNPLSYSGLKGYGEMDRSGTFNINKDKIKHELDIGLKQYGACPAFDYSRTINLYNKIPDKIKPTKSSEWEYVSEYTEEGQVAVSVKLKDAKNVVSIGERASSYKREIIIESETNTGKSVSPDAKIKQNPTQNKGCASILLLSILPFAAVLNVLL